jgi:hypothetical protein
MPNRRRRQPYDPAADLPQPIQDWLWEQTLAYNRALEVERFRWRACHHMAGGRAAHPDLIPYYRPALPYMLLCSECADAAQPGVDVCDHCAAPWTPDAGRCLVFGSDEVPTRLHVHLCAACISGRFATAN